MRPLREITGDSLFNQVFLDEVFVPDDCVVGEVNGGWRVARTTLANERVSLSQTWTFGSRRARAARGGEGGRPTRRSARWATLVCEGHAIDLLGLRVTLKQLSGTEPGATGSVRKLLGMRHAQQVAELCLAMSGPAGALGGSRGRARSPRPARRTAAHWARQVLMTQALTIGGGTTDIQLNIIGERILGLPRDPEPPGEADNPGRRPARSRQTPVTGAAKCGPAGDGTASRPAAALAYEQRHPGGADDRQ